MERAYLERNDRSLRRLERVIDELGDEQRTEAIDGRWTSAVLLARMAFWDRFVQERWQHARRAQLLTPISLDLSLADLFNDASVPAWSLIPHHDAARMALAAADEVNSTIAALRDDAAGAVIATGWDSLLDRSIHRDEHLVALERLVSAPEPG